MKAVVLETRGSEAAVLVKDGTVRIARGSYNVGDTIEYNEAPRPLLRYWAAAAAAAVVAIGLTAGLWVDRNYITYAEVSLDVNPSIVYSINKRDRVLGVQAANEDAEPIVEQLKQDSIRFTPLLEAVERTMEALEGEGYLSKDTDDYVLINVSADDETRQDRLVDEVEDAMTQTMEQDSTLEYHIDRSDRNTARKAKNNGMSTGRYAAWQEASKVERDGGKPSRDDYAKKPVREIIMGKDSPAPDGQARSGQVPGGQAPDGQTPNTTVPSGPTPNNSIPNGQSPGTDEYTPPSGVDNPGSGAEPAGAPNPPAGANPHDDEPRRPGDSDSQRSEDSDSQSPQDSGSQPPQDSAADPGNSVTQPEEANQQSGAPQRDDAKDSTTDQNESPNTPDTNTDDGNGARQDRPGDSGKSSEKADQGDNKAQSNPNGSSDERKQAPASKPDGGKRQTPAGNDGKKPSSSGWNNQGSRSDKSNPGHK